MLFSYTGENPTNTPSQKSGVTKNINFFKSIAEMQFKKHRREEVTEYGRRSNSDD